MNVASILKVKGRDVITVSSTDSISVVAAILGQRRIGAVLVVDDEGRLQGLLSERDIVRALAESGGSCLDFRVQDLMTTNLVTIGPADTIDRVMALMTEKRIRHLPVLEEGKLVGFISIGDVVKSRIDEVEREAAALRDYIATG
ncbi:MAG: inosine-5-monophosphate dehydrogenase [Sneathiella sp.]|jgi:CBS domain-containing protein|uniref:CBS domain-containing protein n=1 Tax=Sneathiella sp. TaxID=1964365 RepID=UPI000C4BBEB5|nr:CBS domain-containing protein [Sneathiella sp.]MAL77662.1 inosine-5-monophosphate dehydrogenase [Sneathiella sp.]|tara:strand:+ start:1395 stop:1826 length:432 start_codon:yes stop_codon:yes gene_type:complete